MQYVTPQDCLRWNVSHTWWLMDQIAIVRKEVLEWQQQGDTDRENMCRSRVNWLTSMVIPLMVQILPQLPVSGVDARETLPTQGMFLGRLAPVWRLTFACAYTKHHPERSAREWLDRWEEQIRQDLIATDPGGGVGVFGVPGATLSQGSCESVVAVYDDAFI